jgi:hypothetical protein
MPHLHALGRRWNLGSDDLLVPALQFALGHAFWCVSCPVARGRTGPMDMFLGMAMG